MKKDFEETKEAREKLIYNVTEDLEACISRLGISYADLARRLDKRTSYVMKILSGEKKMTLGSFSNICHALGFAAEARIGGAEKILDRRVRPEEVEMVEAGRAERKPDVYGDNPVGSEHVPLWDAFMHGDMDGEESYAAIHLNPRDWPAGTVVTITVPVCPCCGIRADEQDSEDNGCAFDWPAWTEDRYS